MAETTLNVRADVDLMILDYLVCLAVSRLLTMVGNLEICPDVESLVESVEGKFTCRFVDCIMKRRADSSSLPLDR
jgi:hypothetical protein